MPYLLVPGLSPQLISDAQANTLPPSMGKYLSQTPTLGADGTGQVLVNPDIPLQQWELNYLLDTGKLANEQQQTAINAAQVGVNSQQLGINAFNAQAGVLGNVLQAYPAFRGPNNWAQYANFVTGTPGAGIPQFLAAAAGQAGGLNYGYLPRGGVEPLKMPDVQSLLKQSKPLSAGQTLTDSINAGGSAPRTQQAGQQAAAPPAAGASNPTSLAVKTPVGGGPGQVYNAALGRWTAQIPGATVLPAGAPGTAATNTPAPNGTASVNPAPAFDARTSPLSAFPATYGRTSVNTPEQMGSVEGIGRNSGDATKIAWKAKYHKAISDAGFGTGSDARSRANAAAGMSEAQAAHEIKHGRNPYTGIHAAEGMASVVTSPTTQHLGHTTLHTGEGGADELHIVIPLERRDQPIPAWALQLADALSPDKDHLRGVGGTYAARGYAGVLSGDQPRYGTIGGGPPPVAPGSMGGNNATRYGPASQPAYGPADYTPSVGGLAGGESAIPAAGGTPGGYVPYADPNGAVRQPAETPYVPDMRQPAERAVAPRNLPHAGGGYGGTPAWAGGTAAPANTSDYVPSIDPVLLGKAARWWAAQHGGSAADGLAALQLPENAAYLSSALGMAGAGQIDAILGPERPTTAPAPRPTVSAPYGYGPTHAANWQQAYLAQQAQGARNLATGDYAGGVMGGVGGGLALAPGRVTTAHTPVHLARGGVLMSGPPDPAQLPPPTHAVGPMGGTGMDAENPTEAGLPTEESDPTMGGMGGMDQGQGSFDPTDPHPSPEALIEIRAELLAPPAANPTPLEQAIRDNWTLDNHGHPTFIGATTPDQAAQSGVPGWAQPRQANDQMHMAQGGVAVIDAGGTIRQGNKPFSGSGDSAVYTNASGQIQAPSSKHGKYTTIPAWQGSPLAQPLTANSSVMNRILATPSLKAAMESTWGARGLIPEDMWAQYLNGLKMLGTAPAAGRIGAGF